jgi:hypothetical protein
MIQRSLTSMISLSLLFSLTHCGPSSLLGSFIRPAPDELEVQALPPLSVPPNFHLRPPSTTLDEKNTLPQSTTGLVTPSESLSPGEAHLLQQLGPISAPPQQSAHPNKTAQKPIIDGNIEDTKPATKRHWWNPLDWFSR